MKVFVTGAGGYIGQVLVKELVEHGHQVIGLARSDKSAAAIKQAGGVVQRGDISNVEALKEGARAADGVLHLALNIDTFDFDKAFELDRAAVTAMADGLAESGEGKPFVLTSGALFMPQRQLSTEDTPPELDNMFSVRAQSEELVKALSKEKRIRGSVVRLAPVVHGEDDRFFVVWLRDGAKQNGHVSMMDEDVRWAAVHRSDAVTVFRLALEKGHAGQVYHAISEQGVPVKEIAASISRHLNVPVRSVSREVAEKEIGFMANVVSRDCRISSDKTQKELGWTPKHPELLEDMEANYFS